MEYMRKLPLLFLALALPTMISPQLRGAAPLETGDSRPDAQAITGNSLLAITPTAGFRLTRIIPTQSSVSVIEGVPEREKQDGSIA